MYLETNIKKLEDLISHEKPVMAIFSIKMNRKLFCKFNYSYLKL